VPRQTVAALMQSNPAFGAFFYQDISQKLDALATIKGNRELNSLMMARVGQAYIHPALFIDASASLYEAGCLMRDKHTNSLLVRDGDQIGIVTGMNMSKAVILSRQPVDTPIGSVAHYDLITVRPDDFLYTALIEMTKHKVRRVVVKDGETFVGVLDEIDLLSFLSSHSHIVAVQVDRATSKQELREASQEIVRTVRIMHNNGVKVRFVAQLVSELTRQILAKLFRLLATPNIDANTCLMVMGSEGRGEQIMKTDQDNALLLRDGAEIPELESFTNEFTETLLDFGYPLCPGGIMVSNAAWCKSQQGYKDALRQWILLPDDFSPINLAIFQDAVPVAGDLSLLTPVRDYMFDLLSGNDAYVANFARTIDTFATPLGLFFNLVVDRSGNQEGIDIKKGGLFPIVHGVRSLALKHRVLETGTADRIRRLREIGVLDAHMANELIESFSFLLELRLRQQLARLTVGVGSSSIIQLGQISSLERDLLKDSLFVVKKFKEMVRHHFRISVF
jgi:CBS domain-containing protein